MHSYRIEDTRHFMGALLASEAFDTFSFVSAALTTFVTYTIDGTFHHDFFSTADRPEDAADAMSAEQHPHRPSLAPWALIRPQLFSLIKGKNPPLAMKLVLRLNENETAALVAGASLPFAVSDIKGLFLNMQYDQGKVSLITGTSLAIFTTDKRLDTIWDEWVASFLHSQAIPYT